MVVASFSVWLSLAAGCSTPKAPLVEPPPPPDVESGRYGVDPAKSPRESKRVLVVYNATSPISRKIAEYYGSKRRIPRTQVIGVKCLDGEQMGETAYRSDIENKVRAVLSLSKNQIDFVV
ncbi:MAG: hypothetical protein JNL62_29270, partial [Bryobacterales bacterium]|nr:hypothetical protein [Bryobacterales bacterium]